jgi:hypothetical protein
MKTRILMVCLVLLLMAGCQITSSSPYSVSTGSPTATVGGELQSLPFADELQKVLDDALKTSNGAGISAAVIVPGYEPC